MRFKLTYLILFSLWCPLIGSAVTLPLPLPPVIDGWQRVNIIDLGSVDLPPTMEIQAGEYKKSMDNYRTSRNIPVLVAQQLGLNNGNQVGLKRYARVMIGTVSGKDGDFEKLDFNILTVSIDDINQLDKVLKAQCARDLNKINQKLIEWYPVTFEKINGMSCIHISYTRQLDNNPVVKVNTYKFQNNDRIHELILSYRISESEIWKKNFYTVLKSFRINNIR